MIPLLVCFVTCAQWIPQTWLWCDTCRSLGGRHGNQCLFPVTYTSEIRILLTDLFVRRFKKLLLPGNFMVSFCRKWRIFTCKSRSKSGSLQQQVENYGCFKVDKHPTFSNILRLIYNVLKRSLTFAGLSVTLAKRSVLDN